jgi:hypothetical protein
VEAVLKQHTTFCHASTAFDLFAAAVPALFRIQDIAVIENIPALAAGFAAAIRHVGF